MDVSESEFKDLLQQYLITLGCKYVDDETMYMKHLQKQASLQNADAQKQLEILNRFESWNRQIMTYIERFQSLGYCRIAHVCLAVKAELKVPFVTSEHWVVCSLSGVNTNKSCQFQYEGKPLYVDEHFTCFATMLWLVFHMADLEFSRVNDCLHESDADLSIKQIMDNYREIMQNKSLLDLYYTAYATVFDVMEQTMKQIEQEVCLTETFTQREQIL